ncbi:hypothetical protein [Allosphingosinicella indica]|uniref:Uncharacterized protein n=1 Tax=Allosphingosinicella indica TaxID=941907 RepID=A0A1X7G4T6_9SPHN|nr:hypothetical protein [Allosphingosinicella indica]SMF64022.1 hypothetical protein SAMN06295910_1152 [Allosphingosinicella indica]
MSRAAARRNLDSAAAGTHLGDMLQRDNSVESAIAVSGVMAARAYYYGTARAGPF